MVGMISELTFVACEKVGETASLVQNPENREVGRKVTDTDFSSCSLILY